MMRWMTDARSGAAGPGVPPRRGGVASREQLLGWALAAVGISGAMVAVALSPGAARSAAAQDWSPFVLVASLLMIGLVADRDGLFATAGHHLARSLRTGPILFIGATAMIGLVTALLNLDTSVAFLTPVFIYTARSRGDGEAPLLFGCLLLSNAGSLFLPGSNLTNLIVLGHLHLTGSQFFARMWLPALVALGVTAAVIGFFERDSLRASANPVVDPDPPVLGLGLVAIVFATVFVVVLPSPALPVGAVAVVAVAIRLVQRRQSAAQIVAVLGVPVLVGLFGLAVALGTLGRGWSAPATHLSHLDAWATAGVAALASVLFNNLPAASLLGARTPNHSFALLIGLNLGPNAFITGSLAWVLWLRAATTAGAKPSIRRATRIGLVAVPFSMVAAIAALSLTGSS